MRILIAFILVLIVFSACRKDEHISDDPNAKLAFSRDSILFDTIFTSVGSVTKRIKVLNKNNDAVSVSNITLAGGNASAFSININGENVSSKQNLIINGKDSLNIFVKVTINPDAKSLPFIVQDSIILTTNGNRQVISLLAYGQNAVFINALSINSNTTWTKNLPYIIYGSPTLRNGFSLTIQPGAKIYFHKDANLNIEGNLIANGSVANPIMFCSDRLESSYSDEPGQWKGILLKRTGNGVINHAIIKNASVGITSDSLSLNAGPKLILSNSIIKNMQVAAYIGYHSELLAFNNLMYNCGNYLIYGIGGGKYNLKQNTFAGINLDFPRKTAALSFTDYLSAKAYNNLEVNLTNNIIWGSLTNELDIQRKTPATIQSNVLNNLIKTSAATYNTNGNILNVEPGFIAADLENFDLQINSIVLKKGYNLSSDPYFGTYLNKDIKDKTRNFPSSLGCYEKY